jgi:dihydroflavonol-4-reductase
MTTLVTGATGFVGGNLTRALADRDEKVRVLVRSTSNDLAIQDVKAARVIGDLLAPESLRQAVSGCETVYHCAANYSFWSRQHDDIYQTNVQGTRNLLDAARAAGVRKVVFTSSVSTIGLPHAGGDPDGPLGDETMPPEPSHLIGRYKQSKFQAEQLALSNNDDDLQVVVVNPCAPVGPWDVKPTPTGRIPLHFARGRIPGYLSTGMNLVDVSDVAQGHILAMEQGKPGERYILGHRNLTLREVFEMLAEITGRRAPRLRFPYWFILGAAYCDQWVESGIMGRQPTIPVEGIKIARHPMYVSSQKAVAELGMPQRPVEAALEKAVRWFTDHGYLRSRG